MSLAFNISSYQDDLRTKIKTTGNDIARSKNIDPNKSITGLQLSETQRKELSVSVFNVSQNDKPTDAAGAQDNKTQTKGAIAVSTFAEVIKNTANAAVDMFTNILNNLIADLNKSQAELSALTSPKTTGQTVNPQENMPTDNQGTKNSAAQPKDSKPDVGFGEETVEDKSDTENPEKTERNNNTQEAQTSSELDKAALKEQQKVFNKAQEELNQKASLFSKLLNT